MVAPIDADTGDLTAWYDGQVKDGKVDPDPVQRVMVEAFQKVLNEVHVHLSKTPAEPKSFLKRVLRQSVNKNVASVKGLYVHGGVGRGKTMIMDKAFEFARTDQKLRVHFNDFMLDVHRRLKLLRMKAKDSDGDPQFLQNVAREIASEVRLIAFDEFQVRDIADAMLMKGLFEELFVQGVVIFATSNVAPTDLYEGGLQRERFLPFIPILKQNIDVLYLDTPIDYRLKKMTEDIAKLDDLYFTPIGRVTLRKMTLIYERLINQKAVNAEAYRLQLSGREWVLKKAVAGQACMLSFSECCEQPRAAEDFIAIAEAFPVLFLHDVPKMGYDRRNEAKRFILLIDTLYDRGRHLVISAEATPEKLYYGKHHEFEFQRTISRLQEMRYRKLLL